MGVTLPPLTTALTVVTADANGVPTRWCTGLAAIASTLSSSTTAGAAAAVAGLPLPAVLHNGPKIAAGELEVVAAKLPLRAKSCCRSDELKYDYLLLSGKF